MVTAFRSSETVKCGEDEYTLALDIQIIDELEDDFDMGFDKLMADVLSKGRVGQISRLLRGLLVRHHPNIDIDQVGGLVMEYGEQFGEGISRLMDKISPQADGSEVKDENPPKAHRGTGAGSSSRGAPRASRRPSSGSKRREPCS